MLATLAPVAASVGLWLLTSSPYALLFAVLGPVIAIASVGDSRLDSRRVRKKERARFDRDYERTRQLIASMHRSESAGLARLAPSARSLIDAPDHDPERWRADLTRPVPIRLGTGRVHSALEVDTDAPGQVSPSVEARLTELREEARFLPAAPIVTDARLGVGCVGPPTIAAAAARAIAVQVVAALPPDRVGVAVPDGQSAWRCLDGIPHRIVRREASDGCDAIVLSPGGVPPEVVIAVAPTLEALPRSTRVVVAVGGSGAEVVRHPDADAIGPVEVEFVTAEDVAGWAARIARRAAIDGVGPQHTRIPASADLEPLLREPSDGGRGLECDIGIGDAGMVAVDLVADGPHAIVGGTTGSGKSELLISWVLAMAAGRAPTEVSFLFVDFKGGASFDPLESLPHCVGVITDLDTTEALRALTSLRAEVRRREKLLAAVRARSLDDMPHADAFARLVIVVDEYAAVVDEYPDLHALFTDLAARGRSLGIHLVLCTQRPGGIVRDGILANSGLRISLRVTSAADSTMIIGTDDAAALPPDVPGRALIATSGTSPRAVQVARAAAADIAAVAGRWASAERARRPWCEPLPVILTPGEFASVVASRAVDGSIPFGLADLPDEQRRVVAHYTPTVHGNLAVIGGAGSGKTRFLDALGRAPSSATVVPVAGDLASIWDAVTGALTEPDPGHVLLLDDVDAVVSSCPDDYAAGLIDRITRLLREGPGVGVHTVVTMQRVPGSLHGLVALCGQTLLLRMPNRQEHLLAGGDTQSWAPDLPPGAGWWRTTRVQIVAGETPPPARVSARSWTVDVATDPSATVIVSSRAAALAGELRTTLPSRAVTELTSAAQDPRALLVSRGDPLPSVLVGDPSQWQAHWGAIGELRSSMSVIFDGCSVADFRTLTGLREPPPPPLSGERAGWRVTPDGNVQRVTLELATEGRPPSGPRHRARRIPVHPEPLTIDSAGICVG
ncbi:FtsK/SpoIIIE domain-containing protein [Glaciihabitans sp. dw_435]|uniref:FtsK/SpoIIIE domain-containing protein n=1 Tax=Glaciihabitans sp. dw_435 TaxID=2720081 RepID=UPI001BD40571|nr:FtsK/SpoIIIE domain-containing protein [Glaciihabitans sp. dw_435]